MSEQEVRKTQNEVNYKGLELLMEINEFPEEEYQLLESDHGMHYESLDGKTIVIFEGYPDAIDEYRLVELRSQSKEFTLFKTTVGMSKEEGLSMLNAAFNVNFVTDHFKYETKTYGVEAVFKDDVLESLAIQYFTTDKSNINE